MGRYESFSSFLAGLDGDVKNMSFQEIESILGRALPPSARGPFGRQWWANTATHSQGLAWLGAGWRVQEVDVPKEKVSFRRASDAKASPLPKPQEAVEFDLPGLSAAASRMLADYAEEARISGKEAMVAILNEAALQRRRELLSWFKGKSTYDGVSSAALIREDRDAR